MVRHAIPFLLALLGTVAVAGSDRDARKAFKEAFRPDAPAGDRIAAVEALAAHDGKDTAKLLLSGIPASLAIHEDLTRRREDVRAGRVRDLPDGDPLPELARLKPLIDDEVRVLGAIEAALRGFREPSTVLYLARDALFREKHWRVRQAVTEALGEIAAPETGKHLVKALSDKDARIRAAAALAVGRVKPPGAVGALAELLEDEAWTVRSAAIEAIGSVGGREAVATLVAHLGRERGRPREDCADRLEELTGQRFGTAAGAWERWWREHGESFGEESADPAEGPERPDPDNPTYYGIPIRTDRAIFILDISESMSYSSVDWQQPSRPGEITRLEAAKREFYRALLPFNSESRFTVIVFHRDVEVWSRQLVPGTEESKERAKAWVKRLAPTGTTNIYGALETAFSLAGMGAGDKRYDLAADTIYLLSDGAPTAEDYSDEDTSVILRAVGQWNRLKRVKIHTIGLKGHDVAFMSKLAGENGGTYVAR
jgi:HEAT repeat protein